MLESHIIILKVNKLYKVKGFSRNSIYQNREVNTEDDDITWIYEIEKVFLFKSVGYSALCSISKL